MKLVRNSVDSSSAGSGAAAAAGQQALRVREVLAGVQAQGDAPPPHELPRREVQVSHVWQIFTEQLLSHLVRHHKRHGSCKLILRQQHSGRTTTSSTSKVNLRSHPIRGD